MLPSIVFTDNGTGILVQGCNGTGFANSAQFEINGVGNVRSESVCAQAVASGTVSVCTFNIEMQIGSAGQWAVQQTWDAIANPTLYFRTASNIQYRLNCTAFTASGGTMSVFGTAYKGGAPGSTSGGVASDVNISDSAGNGLTSTTGSLNVNITGGGSGGGTVTQGTAAAITAPWPVKLSDGTAALGTAGNPIRVDTVDTTVQSVEDSAAEASLSTLAGAITGGKYQVHITDSSIAVTGTFWQTTQPVSASSLPLPTGASTAAKQPALGTAGSASADVLSIQGVASMTPVKVDGSGVTQPVSVASPIAVTGTFWQTTQPVSIASSVAVTGTFWQTTQPVSLASLPALAAGTNTIGSVTGAPATSGGLGLPFSALVSNTATAVKTSAGQVYGWHFGNAANASPVYVQIFNKATGSITLGTTAPDYVIEVPANGGVIMAPSMFPIAHGTAISVAVTSTRTGSTAVGSGAQVTVFYN